MSSTPKRLAYRLIGLAEALLAQGSVDDAYAVARAALRGFVTLADDHSQELDGLNLFLSGIEYFTSEKCKESPAMRNSLIRLYGRLLNLKHAELHDWDHAEHAILRSCVLHGLSGGPASAHADLTRKAKAWRMNPDSSYVVTTGFDKTKSTPVSSPEDYTDTEDEGVDEPSAASSKRKQLRFRGVTEKLIKQRQSPTIAEWLSSLR